MFSMPNAGQLAGFSDNQLQSYLTSPNFQANTTMGGMLGGSTSMTPMGGMGDSGIFGGAGGGMGGTDGLKLLMGGVGTIGNLWNAFQAQKLAKEQFKFSKDFANTNLANQIKSYNTALSDRATARGFTQGDDASKTASYIAENSLEKREV